MSQLAIQNVVNISVSQAPAGLGPFNVNDLALFTGESPTNAFDNGYAIYKTASAVGQDFGSSSKTFAMATAIFAQTPNILAGNGSLIVIPLLTGLSGVTEVQTINFSAVPTSGSYVLNYGAAPTAAIPYSDDAASLQTALRLVSGLGSVTVTGTVGAGFVVTFTGVSGDFPALTVTSSTLLDSGSATVVVTPTITTHGVVAGSTETVLAGILRTQNKVAYCGVISEKSYITNEMIMASNYVQTQDMILFLASATVGDVAVTTGIFWQIAQAGNKKTRCLLYLLSDYDHANLMAAAYAGRGLSVDFSGSNTTITMQLKSLNTILGDTGMSETIFAACQIAGADVYASFRGVPKVFCSSANGFYDQVYNLTWFTTSLAIAGFNALAETGTKLPQTEQGISALKTAYQDVCEQAKANLYCAPGRWTGDTFGNLADFLRNILGIGYYIYSQPIVQQSSADRNARKAPLIQIALKESGAVHTSNVLVNINA